jgi:serine/threonine-protein kinase
MSTVTVVLQPEDVLNDRYRLEERVATGGMGDVWKASDLVLGRTVAVKVLLPSLLTDPQFLTRFRAEARMMAAVHHPGIVQVYDCGEDTSRPDRADYLVMEFVEGEPLSHRITETGRLEVEQTLSIVGQAAQALHAAHTAGIIHRDVKPSNLLVHPDGSVVLVDFGVARSTSVTSITSTNAVPGTVLYMAPEQASGKPVSPATDVYALGAVAYCCLTGNPPFTGDNPLQVAVAHLRDEPPPLPDDVPDDVAALVFRALAKEPAERFASAAAMAAAVQGILAGTGGGVDLATMPTPVLRGSMAGLTTATDMPPVVAEPVRQRQPRGAGILAVAAVVVLAVAGLTAALGFQSAGQQPQDSPGVVTTSTAAAPASAPASELPSQPTSVRRPGSASTVTAGASVRPSATPASATPGGQQQPPSPTAGGNSPTASTPAPVPTTAAPSDPGPTAGGSPTAAPQ